MGRSCVCWVRWGEGSESSEKRVKVGEGKLVDGWGGGGGAELGQREMRRRAAPPQATSARINIKRKEAWP